MFRCTVELSKSIMKNEFEHLMVPDQPIDWGYVLFHVVNPIWDETVHLFRFNTRGGRDTVKVEMYCGSPEEEMARRVQFAEPLLQKMVDVDSIAAAPVPEVKEGDRVPFKVITTPVGGNNHSKDVYASYINRARDAVNTLQWMGGEGGDERFVPDMKNDRPSRKDVYARWVGERLQSSMKDIGVDVRDCSSYTMTRRTRDNKTPKTFEMPLVFAEGEGTVKSVDNLHKRLKRGVGHQSRFGYGFVQLTYCKWER